MFDSNPPSPLSQMCEILELCQQLRHAGKYVAQFAYLAGSGHSQVSVFQVTGNDIGYLDYDVEECVYRSGMVGELDQIEMADVIVKLQGLLA